MTGEKMDAKNGHMIRALGYLYTIVEASEKGYAVAASSVKNRAIKVLFNTQASKRAQYKEEIFAEMQRLGGRTRPRQNILGAVHRGRIAIFAAMTIGEQNIERVVLKEVILGERVARYTYKRTLRHKLSDATRALLQRQYEDIRGMVDRAQLMRGKNDKQLVIRLYDTEANAEEAIRRLKASGYGAETIKKIPLTHIELYPDHGIKVTETTLSGAVGGSIWGGVSGLLASLNILFDPQNLMNVPESVSPALMALIAMLGLICAGIFIGGGIGFFIGSGVKDEDTYLYQDGVLKGNMFVEILTEQARASQAWQLLAQVNMEART
jgi:uncharacterized protein (TIGR02284 family)